MTLLHDKIYEAAFSPDLWKDVLHELSVLVGAEGAILANVSSAQKPWIASDGVWSLYKDFFDEGWAYDNVKTRTLIGTPHRGFISDADHVAEKIMGEQPIYRDFYWKRGFGYAAATLIEAPNGDAIAISIEKKKGLGPVDRAELDLLDTFRPHLARATLLASRFAFSKIEAALHALQMIDLPAAVIGEDSSTLACNTLFETFSQQISIGSRDRIRFLNRKAAAFFDGVMTRHDSGRRTADVTSHSFPIPSDGERPPAIVHLVPVVGSGRDIFLEAAYIMIVTPLRQRGGPSEMLLKGLFDLTPAEARIAACLVCGLTVQAIAAQHRLSVETVRSHVKSLLLKSGTSRQADFLAIVSGFRAL
ncbi:LuxR C-terminal-related transcriptional regulator [Rhizobium sp. NFR03]|uniref:helix-turn-helix transcriptional regulator n=1 Tax=Rhizobium sp. NFR03 TaxID=1566263 RepID=UPI0008C0412F|nr:LuxR C-terminal-related transcriptional regulator [Rhizobium sp. NFR03]SER59124.1 DNA-binding transcriptional regulator, CsgD family [Rhizobium sp. NFR03]